MWGIVIAHVYLVSIYISEFAWDVILPRVNNEKGSVIGKDMATLSTYKEKLMLSKFAHELHEDVSMYVLS